MNKEEFKEIVDLFEGCGFYVEVHPKTWLTNVYDNNGIVQSYYASTGTAQFRVCDDYRECPPITVRDMRPKEFITAVMHDYAKELYRNKYGFDYKKVVG